MDFRKSLHSRVVAADLHPQNSVMKNVLTTDVAAKIGATPDTCSPNSTGQGREASRGNLWRFPFVVFLLTLASVIFVFRGTIESLLRVWQTDTYSYAFLVPLISVYLAWKYRRRAAYIEPLSEYSALLILPLLILVWLVGDFARVLVIQALAFISILVLVVWALLGKNVVRSFRLPLSFLIFAVPVGDGLIPPLQRFTAGFAIKGLQLSQVPAVLQGTVIYTPSGTWEVASACAGLRFLTASFMLGCLFAALFYQKWRNRILFLIGSLALPILANGFRVYSIILFGYLVSVRLAAGIDHVVYGWVFFSIVTLVLFSLGWLWREVPHSGLEAKVPNAQKYPTFPAGRYLHSWPKLVLVSLSFILLSAFAPSASQEFSRVREGSNGKEFAPPAPREPWNLEQRYTGEWMPVSMDADRQFTATYSNELARMQLYIGSYGSAHRGEELVAADRAFFGGPGWVLTSQRSEIVLVDQKPLTVNRTVFRSGDITRVVWTWYWVDGEFTSNPYRDKILHAKARLAGVTDISDLIALSFEQAAGEAAASSVINDFLSHVSMAASFTRR